MERCTSSWALHSHALALLGGKQNFYPFRQIAELAGATHAVLSAQRANGYAWLNVFQDLHDWIIDEFDCLDFKDFFMPTSKESLL